VAAAAQAGVDPVYTFKNLMAPLYQLCLPGVVVAVAAELYEEVTTEMQTGIIKDFLPLVGE
jgi:hypothetical protein